MAGLGPAMVRVKQSERTTRQTQIILRENFLRQNSVIVWVASSWRRKYHGFPNAASKHSLNLPRHKRAVRPTAAAL
jgi:hypothetical protein